MKKTILIFLMAIFIMIGCTSKEKEVTFSKTSQDIWGEIIINDTDKITIPTTLKQLGKDYSFNDVKVKGDGYVGTGLKKEGYRDIQVIVNEKETTDVDENSLISVFALSSSLENSASIVGIKIGDSKDYINKKYGKASYVLASKTDAKKEHWYYYDQDKYWQFIRFGINNNKVEEMEVRYLPGEYLNKE